MSDQLSIGSARHVVLTAGGGAVAALQAGDESQPPVLMLPGYTGSKEDFAPVLMSAADAGFAVSAIDLPGQFESAGPDDPAAYTPEALGQIVVDIARTFGQPVHLLGHSYGGLVARAAVIAAPDVFASLVLMDSGPSAVQGQRRTVIGLLEPVLEAGGMPGVYAGMLALAANDPAYRPPPAELQEFLERRFLASSQTMLLGMGLAIRSEPDRVFELRAALSSAQLPALVICGVDDDVWPADQQEEMAAQLGSRFVPIPGALHSPAIEAPVPTAQALVDFWASITR